MKILMSSHYFLPSIGGLENVSAMLAEEFVRKGHKVRLVTQTTTNGTDRSPFQVFRQPSASTLLALTHWSDVYLQNSVSLRTAWPLVFLRRPWVVVHQTWIPRSGPGALHGRLKHFFLRFATSVSISHDVAGHIRQPSVVIPNPYDNAVFYEMPTMTTTKILSLWGDWSLKRERIYCYERLLDSNPWTCARN